MIVYVGPRARFTLVRPWITLFNYVVYRCIHSGYYSFSLVFGNGSVCLLVVRLRGMLVNSPNMATRIACMCVNHVERTT